MGTRREPSRVKYKFVEKVERFERLDYYAPGGYHPVMIGAELCADRYVIAHKLEFGRSATTWLAENRKQKPTCCLKISSAESAERTREMRILSRLTRAKSELLERLLYRTCSILSHSLGQIAFISVWLWSC
jgi:hypothetical protein